LRILRNRERNGEVKRKRMENSKWSKRVIHTRVGEEEIQEDQKESSQTARKK